MVRTVKVKILYPAQVELNTGSIKLQRRACMKLLFGLLLQMFQTI